MQGMYATPAYNPCRCRAHSQHKLLKYRYFHPSATLKDASIDLRISYNYTRLLWTRLHRRRDFGRLCPMCFEPSMQEGPERGCLHCGFFPGEDLVFEESASVKALDPLHGWASPVHRILPDRGLGSKLSSGNIATLARNSMYRNEKVDAPLLRKHASNLSHLVEVKEDNLTKEIRSLVLEDLKSTYPDGEVSDVAARLIDEEVRTFRISYPELCRLRSPSGLKTQLATNVIRRLGLLYPRIRPTRNSATASLEVEG